MLRLFAHTPERVLPAPTAKLSEGALARALQAGLEYSPPARGPWTIVHVGMLVPECHEIFVCAQGCLRGVVLSAAELGLQRRFSTITVTEEHLRDGQLEDTIIEGVTHILERLPKLPPAVLVYSSCLHHFSGADLGWAYRKLSEAFPDVVFTDCYMTPTLRKSEMPPDNKMRRQLYHGLRPADLPKGGLLVAGSLEAFGPESDFARAAHAAGVPFFELPGMTTYEEYRRMAHARWVVTVNPAALQAGRVPRRAPRACATFSCCSTTTSSASTTRSERSPNSRAFRSGTPRPRSPLPGPRSRRRPTRSRAVPWRSARRRRRAPWRSHAASSSRASASRTSTRQLPVADKTDFEILRKKAPGILVHPTTVPEMRFATPAEKRDDIVAIGQKAAFFTGATHMLNMIEGGPWWGHGGVRSLALALAAAARDPSTSTASSASRDTGATDVVRLHAKLHVDLHGRLLGRRKRPL